MKTRLRERTKSSADLREVIDSKENMPMEQFNQIKANLRRAVFEEWYFKKKEEDERAKRDRAMEEAEKR